MTRAAILDRLALTFDGDEGSRHAAAEVELQMYDRERDQERGVGMAAANPCRVCGRGTEGDQSGA